MPKGYRNETDPSQLTGNHRTKIKGVQMTVETFKDAVNNVAESSGITKGAITRYITARISEKLERLEEETGDIEKLLGA